MRQKELMESLFFSLENHDWQEGMFTTCCKQTGVEIWTNNGATFCKPYNPEIEIGMINRIRLWKAVQRMRAKRVQSQIYGAVITQSLADSFKQFDRELKR